MKQPNNSESHKLQSLVLGLYLTKKKIPSLRRQPRPDAAINFVSGASKKMSFRFKKNMLKQSVLQEVLLLLNLVQITFNRCSAEIIDHLVH